MTQKDPMAESPMGYLIDWVLGEDPLPEITEEAADKERGIILHCLQVQFLSELEMRSHMVPRWMTSRQYREFLQLFFVPAYM